MGDILLDPTDVVERERKAFAPRLETLAGKTVGLMATGGNIDRPLYLDILGEDDDRSETGEEAA